VYEARHRALGKRFALKALRRELAAESEIAARFIQEARTAAAVSHPGLVEITDFGKLESGQVYFVMELLEGSTLAALLRGGGPLPAARALTIVRQLGLALKAAHDAGIVHRDLKPDNIHVGRTDGDVDLVKIVDFGLAKVIGASGFTRAGMVFGTPHYMSPEQAAGEAVDHRADIYALGVVMYEMFAGKLPFEADSYMGVLTKHLYMLPAPPSSLNPELRSLGALEDVILRALQKRPDARYENVAELLADLERRLPASVEAARAVPGGTMYLADQLELPAAAEQARPRRYDPWRPLALGLSLVAIAALAVALGGRSTRPAPPALTGNHRALEPPPVPSSEAATAPPPAASPQREVASPQPPGRSQAPIPSAPAAEPILPARKPTARGPHKVGSSAPKVAAPPAKPAPPSSEIRDPWAR
jgi:eukaryotic-like serine/threonine-protein kinase